MDIRRDIWQPTREWVQERFPDAPFISVRQPTATLTGAEVDKPSSTYYTSAENPLGINDSVNRRLMDRFVNIFDDGLGYNIDAREADTEKLQRFGLNNADVQYYVDYILDHQPWTSSYTGIQRDQYQNATPEARREYFRRMAEVTNLFVPENLRIDPNSVTGNP